MTLLNISDMADYGRAWLWASNVAKGKYKYNMTINYLYGSPRTATSITDGAGASFGESPNWKGTLSLKNDIYSNTMQDIGQGTLDSNNAQDFSYVAKHNSKAEPIYLTNPVGSGENLVSFGNYAEVYLIKSTNTINYTPEDSDVKTTEGRVVHSQAAISSAPKAQNNFQFSPNTRNSFALGYKTGSTATYTTTNGTKQSTSTTTGTSFSTTDTFTASVGVEDVSSESASLSLTQGWSNSWTSMKEVDFSQANGNAKTEQVQMTKSISPEDDSLNAGGTYGYDTIYENGRPTNKIGFVPGVHYTATVIENTSTINNNLSGSYTIGGAMGFLKDNIYTGATTNGDGGSQFDVGGGQVTPSVATAIYAAESANYSQSQPGRVDLSGFDLDSSYQDNPLQIKFNGTAVGSSKVISNWNVIYSENADGGVKLLNYKKADSSDIDLNDFDTTKRDGLGVSFAFRDDSNGSKSISGTGHTDIAHASANGEHKFSKFTDSFLHGNDNDDVFDLDRKASGNSIFALGGDDKIKSSSSQTASMGEGNDVYTINSDATTNSLHQIHLGSGEDEVIVDSANAEFTIADFDPFMDTVKVGASLKKDLLTGKLVPFENGKEILDNAKIQFYYDGSPIGIAYLSTDADFIQHFVDPLTQQSLHMFNSAEFKDKLLKDGHSAYDYFANSVSTGVAYSRPLTLNDWGSMDNSQRAQIMSEVSSFNGLDLTNEFHLDTLANHQNPSDFYQIFFG